MTQITWGDLQDRDFEAGLDRGVLYFPGGSGVPWNGLISVQEKTSHSIAAVHFDGVKFNDIVDDGDYSAVLTAFTYPDEFLEYQGVLEDEQGFFVNDQPRKRFNLSYRTKVGDGTGSDPDKGYKIHLLYNLTALPTAKTYKTLSLDTEPMEFQWDITSIPEELEGYRPTAHVIVDARRLDPFFLTDLEDILYGSEENDPTLPSLKGIMAFARKWERLIIIDNGDGTWTATTQFEGFITEIDSTTYEIESDTIVSLDSDTYTISSSEKEIDDTWLP